MLEENNASEAAKKFKIKEIKKEDMNKEEKWRQRELTQPGCDASSFFNCALEVITTNLSERTWSFLQQSLFWLRFFERDYQIQRTRVVIMV